MHSTGNQLQLVAGFVVLLLDGILETVFTWFRWLGEQKDDAPILSAPQAIPGAACCVPTLLRSSSCCGCLDISKQHRRVFCVSQMHKSAVMSTASHQVTLTKETTRMSQIFSPETIRRRCQDAIQTKNLDALQTILIAAFSADVLSEELLHDLVVLAAEQSTGKTESRQPAVEAVLQQYLRAIQLRSQPALSDASSGALQRAIDAEDLEELQELLVSTVTEPQLLAQLLCTALEKRHFTCAHALLDAGADPAYNRSESLRLAIIAGNRNLVRRLVEAGAQICARDQEFLNLASSLSRSEILCYFSETLRESLGVSETQRPSERPQVSLPARSSLERFTCGLSETSAATAFSVPDLQQSMILEPTDRMTLKPIFHGVRQILDEAPEFSRIDGVYENMIFGFHLEMSQYVQAIYDSNFRLQFRVFKSAGEYEDAVRSFRTKISEQAQLEENISGIQSQIQTLETALTDLLARRQQLERS